MSFIEERLLESLSYGFSGGPTWATNIVTLRSGISRRNVRRDRPLHRFRGSFDRRQEADIQTLLGAFNATAGAAYGFRFKNPLEYQAFDELIGVGTGVEQDLQLVRSYVFGPNTRTVSVRKPNNDVVVRNLETGAVVASSVDTTTGIVTLTAPPGDRLSWTGTFDLPVTFDSDEFVAVIENWDATTVDISLSEDLAA
jgi:uncharacterized protein (TIGR02217 family)